MRVSVQTERIEENRHQDEEHQSTRLSDVLGARSAAVAVRYVPRVRPTGFAQPTTGYNVPSGRS